MTPSTLQTRAGALAQAAADWLDPLCEERADAVRLTLRTPNTFTAEAIEEAIGCTMRRVTEESLLAWIGKPVDGPARRVCVLNAGNVPFVGLQDLLAVLLTGNEYLGVTSSRSPYLLPSFASSVRRYEPDVVIDFFDLDGACGSAEALIATGSSATTQLVSRRFLAAGVPSERQLLRGTRQGAAMLNGNENAADLYGLARDALLHEGRGCRNVAVILAPSFMDPRSFADQAHRFRRSFPAHPSTRKGIARAANFLRAVGEPFIRGDGFIVIEGDVALREPAVIRWVRHDDESEAVTWLQRNAARLQVVVQEKDRSRSLPASVEQCGFGSSQDPTLDWRPDGVDTISFLRGLAVASF